MFLRKCYAFLNSEADTGLYTAKASNGADSSTCSSQLIVRESKSQTRNIFWRKFHLFDAIIFTISESEEEKKSFAEQNTPYFAIRLTDTEVMENTYLRFMVKIIGEPRPKIQL